MVPFHNLWLWFEHWFQPIFVDFQTRNLQFHMFLDRFLSISDKKVTNFNPFLAQNDRHSTFQHQNMGQATIRNWVKEKVKGSWIDMNLK